eukprot:scaffold27982_cov31-Tisochrysis_lutea.AAC.13
MCVAPEVWINTARDSIDLHSGNCCRSATFMNGSLRHSPSTLSERSIHATMVTPRSLSPSTSSSRNEGSAINATRGLERGAASASGATSIGESELRGDVGAGSVSHTRSANMSGTASTGSPKARSSDAVALLYFPVKKSRRKAARMIFPDVVRWKSFSARGSTSRGANPTAPLKWARTATINRRRHSMRSPSMVCSVHEVMVAVFDSGYMLKRTDAYARPREK